MVTTMSNVHLEEGRVLCHWLPRMGAAEAIAVRDIKSSPKGGKRRRGTGKREATAKGTLLWTLDLVVDPTVELEVREGSKGGTRVEARLIG